MMSRTIRDVVVCSAIIVIAAIGWYEASKLPPGLYDPLGGGAMPEMVSAAIIVLSLAAIADALIREAMTRQSGTARVAADPGHPWKAAIVFACAVVAAIGIWARVPYWICAPLFVFLSVAIISDFRRRSLIPAAIFALILGLGLNFLFGSVFNVDIP